MSGACDHKNGLLGIIKGKYSGFFQVGLYNQESLKVKMLAGEQIQRSKRYEDWEDQSLLLTLKAKEAMNQGMWAASRNLERPPTASKEMEIPIPQLLELNSAYNFSESGEVFSRASP